MEAGGTMDSAAVPTPGFVGTAFVSQYYYFLYTMPEQMHRFYVETSKVGRVGQDGVMRDFSTFQGIKEEFKTLTYGESVEITSYDAQESHHGGILLVVTGYFTLKENLRRKFTQTFFLAPQETGFFVLNDILRFVNEDAKENVPEDITGEVVTGKSPTKPSVTNEDIAGEVVTGKSPTRPTVTNEDIAGEVVTGKSPTRPTVTNEDIAGEVVTGKSPTRPTVTNEDIAGKVVTGKSPTRPTVTNEDIAGEVVTGKSPTRPTVTNAPTGNKGSKQAAGISANPVWKEVSKPLNNEKVKENVLVPGIVKEDVPEIEVTCKEVADDSLKNKDTHDGPEDVPKKSYASVLKVTKDKSGVSAVSSLPPKKIPEDQEHQAPSDSSSDQILKNQGQQASSDPSQVIESDTVSEVVDANESWQNEEAIPNATSIYVKHLPANANIDMVKTAFKQFGAIINDGVQVISNRNFGYPFGFVEFEEEDAAQRAIEASPVIIGGQRAFVEEKLSTSRGFRGSGNGGHGNRNVGVGMRGRGGYGYDYNYRRGGGGGGRSFNRRGDEYVATINSY